jgi:ribulose-phosphate 3-epimerase
MDGHYVPNFTLGLDFCKALSSYTEIPLDIHLMINNPDSHVEQFAQFKNAVISFHPETAYHPLGTIHTIKKYGARAGIAVDPSIPLQNIEYLLQEIDLLNVMTVNPGYAGQKLIPQMLDKLSNAADIISQKGYAIELQVDGNVSWDNIPTMLEAGARVFVAGTSSIFQKDTDLTANITKFRAFLGTSSSR